MACKLCPQFVEMLNILDTVIKLLLLLLLYYIIILFNLFCIFNCSRDMIDLQLRMIVVLINACFTNVNQLLFTPHSYLMYFCRETLVIVSVTVLKIIELSFTLLD